MRYLYTFLFYLALPFVFLRLLWRARRSVEYRKRWAERLGFCPYRLDKSIWIHAASVGETLAAIPLVKALQASYPTLPIVITNMTITGAARTKAAFGDTVKQAYIPYDVPAALNRFIKRTNPVIALILETELWPNLFYVCEKKQIPLMVINARLSEKSATGYRRIKSLTAAMMKATHTMAIQTQEEATRFISLGLSPNKAVITGNIKFDIEMPADLREKSQSLRTTLGGTRLIWVAASTHSTEEEIILAAHKQILKKHPTALLILVPRHPERFDSVSQLITQQGFSHARRSKQNEADSFNDISVYLGDTMGELLLMYAASDVAFIGGSFVSLGGHNMLEAAVQGKPVITGPSLFNFAEISKSLIASKGMIKVQNEQELVKEILHLFDDSDYRHVVGENARQFVAKNRGALAKQLNVAKAVIDNVIA